MVQVLRPVLLLDEGLVVTVVPGPPVIVVAPVALEPAGPAQCVSPAEEALKAAESPVPNTGTPPDARVEKASLRIVTTPTPLRALAEGFGGGSTRRPSPPTTRAVASSSAKPGLAQTPRAVMGPPPTVKPGAGASWAAGGRAPE